MIILPIISADSLKLSLFSKTISRWVLFGAAGRSWNLRTPAGKDVKADS
jgi:hypothetical protein